MKICSALFWDSQYCIWNWEVLKRTVFTLRRAARRSSQFQASGLDLDRFPRMAKKYSLLQFYFAFFRCSRKLKFNRFIVRNARKIFVQIVLFVILLDFRFEVKISRNISVKATAAFCHGSISSKNYNWNHDCILPMGTFCWSFYVLNALQLL